MALNIAAIAAVIWISAAVVMARRRSAPVLWGRAALTLVVAYVGGVLLGLWPLTAVRPLIDIVAAWLGG